MNLDLEHGPYANKIVSPSGQGWWSS